MQASLAGCLQLRDALLQLAPPPPDGEAEAGHADGGAPAPAPQVTTPGGVLFKATALIGEELLLCE